MREGEGKGMKWYGRASKGIERHERAWKGVEGRGRAGKGMNSELLVRAWEAMIEAGPHLPQKKHVVGPIVRVHLVRRQTAA